MVLWKRQDALRRSSQIVHEKAGPVDGQLGSLYLGHVGNLQAGQLANHSRTNVDSWEVDIQAVCGKPTPCPRATPET